MRNDNRKWQNPIDADQGFSVPGVRVSSLPPPRQILLSGIAPTALRVCGCHAAFGWPDIVQEETFALRLRRDRVMIVNGPQLEDGWDATNELAVSDVSDGYQVLEICGPRALDLIQRGAEVSLAIPSASAVRQFAGFEVLLYRWRTENQYHLHIPQYNAQALLLHLGTVAQDM